MQWPGGLFTSQTYLMSILYARGTAGCRMGEIGLLMNLEKSSVTRLVDNLVRDGVLSKENIMVDNVLRLKVMDDAMLTAAAERYRTPFYFYYETQLRKSCRDIKKLLPPGVFMPQTEDYLVFEKAGAYGYAMAFSHVGRTRPAEVLVDQNGQMSLIRRHELLDSLWRLVSGFETH